MTQIYVLAIDTYKTTYVHRILTSTPFKFLFSIFNLLINGSLSPTDFICDGLESPSPLSVDYRNDYTIFENKNVE